MPDPGPASKVVLAAAVPAGDADRHTRAVDGDDSVHAIGFAGAAVVLEGLAGPVGVRW